MTWLEQRWYSKQSAPFFLKPFVPLYKFLAAKKKTKDLRLQWQAPVPVIVVGNISVGGTGKTPLAIYLVSLLKKNGFNPGIISRGYKSKAPHYPFDVSDATDSSQCGDEPYMLHKRCDCPVVIAPDRVSAAKCLLQKYNCDLIISDDGLQHYKLGRDIEIVVVDGERGFGNKSLLPAGPLREDISRLSSVDFVVSNGIWRQCKGNINALQMDLVLENVMSINGAVADKQEFNGKTVHGVAGIGNPERFFNTLREKLGVRVISHPMPDHHDYAISDFEFEDSFPVLMTEKDAVKVKSIGLNNAWYLEVLAHLPDEFSVQLLKKLHRITQVKGNQKNG